MEFSDIIKALDEHKDSDEYKSFVNGLLDDDRVTAFLASDKGKAYAEKYLNPERDKQVTSGIETWKKNHLAEEVDKKYKELHPDADPKDAELAKLKAEIAQVKAENTRKDLTNKALSVFNDKKLPVELVDFFIGADEETTNTNIKKLEKAFSSALSAAVEAKVKDSTYTPPSGSPDKEYSMDELANMSIDEINKYYNSKHKK